MKRETNKEDLLDSLTFSRSRMAIFKKLPVNRQGFVLLELSNYIQKKIINELDDKEIVKILDYLDSDRAAVLLRRIIKEPRRDKVIAELGGDIKRKVEFLLKFDPGTAASLINLNYIEVDKNLAVKEVAKIVQEYEKKTKRFPEILVVEDGFLLGELEGQSLFLHPNKKTKECIKKIPSIQYDKDKKEVIDLFQTHPHKQIVVLDADKSILGIIYSDDILKLINKEGGEGLSRFAGVREEEDVYDPAWVKVRNRYKWLILNLGTAFLAASVVSLFRDTISTFVLLAVYMPIIAGMGGNAGTQTFAVMVRGLALRQVQLKTARRVIMNEVIAGATNGVIIGIIVAVIASVFNQNPLFGLIVGIAMVVNLIIAGFFGALIPLIMKKLGKDPATSATIFITTCTDVFGFFVFLGLAALLL